MKKSAFILVAFLFATTSLFGQIDTQAVNGWVPIAWSEDLEEYSSCIVDSPSPFPIYPNPKSTKSQMFRIKGTNGAWIEIEKEYGEEYTVLPAFAFFFRLDVFPPEENGTDFGQIVIAPTFALDSVYFPSLNPVIDLWYRYWTPFPCNISEEHQGKKFKKIRFRFTLQYADSAIIYIDNVGLGDLDPLIDNMGEDAIVGVEDVPRGIPTDFILYQNYPNPFNPTTSIKYLVSSIQYVKIQVFDILGREIATLVDGEKHPGTYEVVFNASHLPSGTYFYRLTTKDFVETKKMLLIK